MSTDLDQHLSNRKLFLSAIAGEVFGPGSQFDTGDESLLLPAKEIDVSKLVQFADWKSYWENRPVVKDTGEEILMDERPIARYGLGILFPKTGENDAVEALEQAAAEEMGEASEELEPGEVEALQSNLSKSEKLREKQLEKRLTRSGEAVLGASPDDGEEVDGAEVADMRLANLRRQRSIGVSFVVDAAKPGDLSILVTGGRYARLDSVKVTGSEKKIRWWAREGVCDEQRIPLSTILATSGYCPALKVKVPVREGLPTLDLNLEVLVRGRDRIPGNVHPTSARLLTVSLVNRTDCADPKLIDLYSFFQARFKVVAGEGGNSAILAYPRSGFSKRNEEQQSLDLLYRREMVFAAGHGCAGTWQAVEGAPVAEWVRAEPLPACETPAITPELEYGESGNRKKLSIPVALLADEERTDEALGQLRLMTELYETWIGNRETELDELPEEHRKAGARHVKRGREALARMKAGINLLAADPESDASVAFRLTNRAMLLQALASRAPSRIPKRDSEAEKVIYEPPYQPPDLGSDNALERAWRPFQIAFFLMNLEALADPVNPGREIVDLIWFPTGGGKTEAYLACAAFSMFARRLRNPMDVGTEVIMRYTLRLLTAQQFQRASSLICAMEEIRDGMEDRLGSDAFRIGIWVGGGTTPNNISGAKGSLSRAKKNGEEDYKMVLLKCPWCGAVMGPRRDGHGFKLDGIRSAGQDVYLHCPDRQCRFKGRLPVEVIDEVIYEQPPEFVIATVDKFAALAWRQECRSLFGLGEDGARHTSPPGLIIQDELHLITGPLGSMVGLYEALVDELSTDRRAPGRPLKPKLISATATTRASDRQIRDIYARSSTAIFPPPGLDATDSFFAKYARDDEGCRLPGRLYVGILPSNYSSSLTASVRLFSSALAAAWGFSTENERDPWWTLLVFYNSLRELGGALTLFGADIPERLKNIQKRWYPGAKWRYVREVLELTGRLSNSEVPRALEALGRPYVEKPERGRYPVDGCLASNIIEVGVDVDRLGVMAVAGQPKTTAQYIQATGRVGRALPGLILTLYGASKPRDRSHYEHFQAYHGRLYAQVEPASVTPFTIPVLERALHAIVVAWVRQTRPIADLVRPAPFAGTALESTAQEARDILVERVGRLAPDTESKDRMIGDINSCFDRRIDEWKVFEPMIWHDYFPKGDSADKPLIRPYGTPCPTEWLDSSWETPNSLRGVDAECRPHIPHVTSDAEDES